MEIEPRYEKRCKLDVRGDPWKFRENPCPVARVRRAGLPGCPRRGGKSQGLGGTPAPPQSGRTGQCRPPSRVDELADSFAEIEGTDRSTQVFDEMTRILAEEGVDQALAYVATQRPSILEKVRARANAAREKNRADLLPLLKSAQLQADRNQPDEATRLFAEILAVESDWPDALDAQFWFLITQGDHAFNHATLDEIFGHFQAAETTVHHLLKAEPDAPARSVGELRQNRRRAARPGRPDLGLKLLQTGPGHQTKAGSARSGQRAVKD
jgi:hypothetical protein